MSSGEYEAIMPLMLLGVMTKARSEPEERAARAARAGAPV